MTETAAEDQARPDPGALITDLADVVEELIEEAPWPAWYQEETWRETVDKAREILKRARPAT